MLTATLHSNGQLREMQTERKDDRNLLYSRRLLKDSVKEPNMLTYFFFPRITQWCSISNVLFTDGRECQILLF